MRNGRMKVSVEGYIDEHACGYLMIDGSIGIVQTCMNHIQGRLME